jgi:hypothetical protein
MIILQKGNTETIYVTPKENTELNFEHYKIVFTNRITKDIVEYWFTDISTTERYQSANIVVNTYFQNEDEGFWTYEIYGTATFGGTPNSPILESGFMYLYPTTAFNPTKYNEQSNSFVTYNG